MLVLILLLATPALSANFLGRIINGQNARSGEFPWIASLQTSSHICGGTLIADRWILTAAHCFSSASNLKAWVGKLTLSDSSSGTMHTADLVVRHPLYNRPNEAGAYSHDIALVRLTTPSSVTPINRATANSGDFSGSSCTIAGWGYTQTGPSGSLPDNLQKYSSKALSHAECSAVWGSNYAEPSNICISGSGGACNGDSGGPMICGNVLAGVTSFGASGCTTSYPSVYTRVSFYDEWITNTMSANS